MQFALRKASAVSPTETPRLNRVSPGRTMYATQFLGGAQNVGAGVIATVTATVTATVGSGVGDAGALTVAVAFRGR
jgi:hypothetical protein